MTPRSHMLLRIDLPEGPHVVDVGFGGLTLTGPLRLEADTEQATPHEPFRLVPTGDAFVMQAKIDGEWKPLYRFDQQEQFLPDYEVTNWYLSNNPNSHFVTGLVAARPDPDRRYALRNTEFAVHHLNGGGSGDDRDARIRRVTPSTGSLRVVLVSRCYLPRRANFTMSSTRTPCSLSTVAPSCTRLVSLPFSISSGV